MARRSSSPPPTPAPAAAPLHELSYAALVEYLGAGAVTELVIVETPPGRYQVQAVLSWRSGRSVLVAARGNPRSFSSLDTIARLLRTSSIGLTQVRLELRR